MIGYDQLCVVLQQREQHIADLERQVAALTKERDGRKQQCEDHCGTISGLLRENMEKHQVYCPHCNPCRHVEQLAAAQAVNEKLRERIVETTTEDMHGKVWRICCCTQTHEAHTDYCILAIPTDTTTTLQQRLAEEREKCAERIETVDGEWITKVAASALIRSMK